MGFGERLQLFLEHSGKQLKGFNQENPMAVLAAGWRLGQQVRRGSGESLQAIAVAQSTESGGLH